MARASTATPALALLAVALVGDSHPTQLPDLAGTWVLNQEESDDARAQLGAMREDVGPPAGGNTGRRRPGTPRAGGVRRAPGQQPGSSGERDVDAEAMRIFIQLALQPARRLSITQPDSTVIITADNEHSLVLVTDGRTRRDSLAEVPMDVSATWEDDGHLVITRRIESRVLRERYARAPDADQLIVETRVSLASGNSVELRRVYDAATVQPRDREQRRPDRDPQRRPPGDRSYRP